MGDRLPPVGGDSARRRVREEVDEELRSHFEGTVDLLVDRGMTEEEARREAYRRFGDVDGYRRELEEMGNRRTRRRMMRTRWSALRTSLVFAWRTTVRGPSFAAAVIVTLALGIGANLAMFDLVDRLLLSPPEGIEEPDELRRLWVRRTSDEGVTESRAFSWSGYRDFVGLGTVEGVAAYASGVRLTLGGGPEAERVRVQQVSGSYFPLLGTRASAGRLIGPADDAMDAPPVAVLGHSFWTRRFGADPGVIGTRLHLGEGRYEVVGVVPPGFTGVELGPVDVWLPVVPSGVAENGERWVENRRWWWLRAVARVGPEEALPAAEEELTAAHRGGHAELESYDGERAEIFTAPLLDARGPDPSREARVALWLGGVSLVVLLVMCANVANLFLARAERWRRELAVRMALGVGRGRLLGELLTESLFLTLLGAAAALAVLRLAAGPMQALLFPDVAFGSGAVDGRLLVFTGMVATLSVVLAGLLPAWRASRMDAGGALRREGTSVRSGARTRGALVVFQTALSTVLLVGAGLFLRSFEEARGFDVGFDAERVAVMRLERGEDPTESSADLYRTAELALPRLPGVASAARMIAVPFSSGFKLSVHVPELDSTPRHPESGTPYVDAVGADYFETMGIEVVRGRGFEETDVGEGAEPVAVVTAAMADHVWAGDAVGRCVRVGGEESACARVVGVAEDINTTELAEPPAMIVWLPQGNDDVRGVAALAVRLSGDPADALAAVRREVAGLSPSIRYVQLEMLSVPLARLLRSWRLGAAVLTAFAVLAWLVAGIGLYGLLAFDVARRTRELGIRKALGAPYRRLVTGVGLRGVRLVVAGLVAGLGLAWLAADRVAPLLFETSARSAQVYGLTASLLLLVALLATALPAHRAARADPRETIRAE